MTDPAARERFAVMARREDPAIDLAEAALLIAEEEYAGLDPLPYQAYLTDLAERVRAQVGDNASVVDLIGGLNHEIFDAEGFRGNTEDYYDPRNSFLNDVIDRRKGIPITLSVVYLEVGWRLRLPLAGVGMPGHFLVKYETDGDPILIDPFDHGAILTTEDCERRLNQLYGGSVRLQPDYLAAVSKRQILIRMLTNLKGIYLQRSDFDRALAAVDRVLLLAPNDLGQYRDRGLIHFRRQDYSAAAGDLQTYLQTRPEPPDAPAMRRALEEIWRQQSRLN
ncbi:MAG TPA: tetratricopeptide repeat protein [Dehalococcoidia bacterium]|nr:tetratricopeptide repeat protein [Dehalococcoidia bacterium]